MRDIGPPETIGELVVDGRSHSVGIDRGEGRFVVDLGQDEATLEFELAGSVLSLVHTEVPVVWRRKGVGAGLARAALNFARVHDMTVMPDCPFVAAYIKRHPQYGDLVDPAFRRRDGRRR